MDYLWIVYLVVVLCLAATRVNGSTINMVTYNASTEGCTEVDEQQYISNNVCTQVDFGGGVYLVRINCASASLSSSWTFALFSFSQSGCLRQNALRSGSGSGSGCYSAIITYLDYQLFSIRCDGSAVETSAPSFNPTRSPTTVPTYVPTASPTSTPRPSAVPTVSPTRQPTFTPTYTPTYPITPNPTASPSFKPGLSYTAHYAVFDNTTCVTTANATLTRSFNSGSIPSMGNCSSIPMYHHNTTTGVSAVVNMPGRLHCFDTSRWTLELYTDRTCASTTLVLQRSESSTGCFTQAITASSSTATWPSSVTFHVQCEEIYKSPAPTMVPTVVPTRLPTFVPTRLPTAVPSIVPTALPTWSPSALPTRPPSLAPSASPTAGPSVVPSRSPTQRPSWRPSNGPTVNPTRAPSTPRPSISLRPSTFAPSRPTTVLAKIRFFTLTSSSSSASSSASVATAVTTATATPRAASNDDDDPFIVAFDEWIGRDAAAATSANEEAADAAVAAAVEPTQRHAAMTTASSNDDDGASTSSTYATSCVRSLASTSGSSTSSGAAATSTVTELGSWTLSRSTCVTLSSLASSSSSSATVDAIASAFNNEVNAFYVQCIPKSSTSSGSTTYSWVLYTFASSTSCAGVASHVFTGPSACACAYTNATGTTSSVLKAALMVDCDFTDASAACDTATDADNGGTTSNDAFSVSTQRGVQNIIAVVVAAFILVLSLGIMIHSTWRRYLATRREAWADDGRDCYSWFEWETWWYVLDVLIGRWVWRCGRFCCACFCCWAACCWVSSSGSGSVTPRDGDDDDDEDNGGVDGGDQFDMWGLSGQHRRARRRGSQAVAMAEATLLDVEHGGTVTTPPASAAELANTTAVAVAVQRRLSAASTSSASTLQVAARPYDEIMDSALPTAQLSTRQHPAAAPPSLFSLLFRQPPPSSSSSRRGGRHRSSATPPGSGSAEAATSAAAPVTAIELTATSSAINAAVAGATESPHARSRRAVSEPLSSSRTPGHADVDDDDLAIMAMFADADDEERGDRSHRSSRRRSPGRRREQRGSRGRGRHDSSDESSRSNDDSDSSRSDSRSGRSRSSSSSSSSSSSEARSQHSAYDEWAQYADAYVAEHRNGSQRPRATGSHATAADHSGSRRNHRRVTMARHSRGAATQASASSSRVRDFLTPNDPFDDTSTVATTTTTAMARSRSAPSSPDVRRHPPPSRTQPAATSAAVSTSSRASPMVASVLHAAAATTSSSPNSPSRTTTTTTTNVARRGSPARRSQTNQPAAGSTHRSRPGQAPGRQG